MCGRYTLTADGNALAERFGVPAARTTGHRPRYNIAPGQEVPVVRADDPAGRTLSHHRWGLVPHWAKDPKIGSRLINARAETAHEKPAFRSAFRSRRCLVPADGFFEWAREGRRRQPYWFRLRSGEPFAFAGLWERWEPEGAAPLETVAILTTEANDLVRRVHARMPVILPRVAEAIWLDPAAPPDRCRALLRPFPAEAMTAAPVHPAVGNPRNDDPKFLAVATEPGFYFFTFPDQT